jgi:hypothetical protein
MAPSMRRLKPAPIPNDLIRKIRERGSMADTILMLELLDYGVTPASERLLVRALRKGFSVIVQYDEGFEWARPRRLYSSKKPYSWRNLARCLPTLSNSDRISPTEEAARHVVVTGEKGLIAEILRYAYASGDGGMPGFVALLISQTDDCLSCIEQMVHDHIPDYIKQSLTQIEGHIRELGLTTDLCTLYRDMVGLHELNLKALSEHLDGQSKIKAANEAASSEATIKPFREKIEVMVTKFDDQRLRGGGITWPSKRARVRHFLEAYVASYGRLPSGPTHIKSDTNSFNWDLGIINFDEA